MTALLMVFLLFDDNPEAKTKAELPPQQPTTADAEVYFPFDSALLDSDDKTAILAMAERAKDTPGTTLILDAHADPRGTGPYNVALTVRRAEAVRDFLTENGFNADRVVMAMYGEDGPRRDSFEHDRRVSITLTAEPLYSIIDGSKPYATAVVWNEPVTYAEIEGPEDKVARTARR